jgi:protein-S-isoprenylcysteine O-methyltransferase Ste14
VDNQPLTSFFILLLAFAIYAILHSILASHTFKNWLESIAGEAWMKCWYRFVFNAMGVITLLPIFYLMTQLPNQLLYVIPFPWRWLTYGLQALGLWVVAASLMRTGLLDFLGLRQIGSQNASAPSFTSNGYYEWVRHPFYSGAMLFLWMSARVSVLSLALTVAISLYFWIGAIFEERKLKAFFGRQYVEYAARTPMFVPRFFRRAS